MKSATVIALVLLACGCSAQQGAGRHRTAARTGPPDLSGVFRVVPVTPEISRACDAALKRMRLVSKIEKEQPCSSIEAAQQLIWRSINIATAGSCAEHNGWYFFSRLDWAKPDDGTFGSGYAVKKGTTEIHRWE